MPALSGKSGTLTLGGFLQLKVNTWEWNPVNRAVATVGMSDGGYEGVIAGVKHATWTAECDWHTTPAGGEIGVPPAIKTDALIAFILKTDVAGAKTYSGNALITTTPIRVDVNGKVTFRIEGEVDGIWTEV